MGNYSYYKQQRYKSIDGGVTWEAEDVFQKGAMIEPQNPYMCNPLDRWVEDGWMCDDCPPIPTNYKWLATYATRMSFAECDGTSAITSGEVATTDLVSVSIGDCVTTIGTLAFQHSHTFTSVTIPDSVTEIGDYAFENCDNLSNATIGNGLTSIGSNAFENCESLTSVTIPDSVTIIGDGAFSYCTSLSSVTIPDSVTEIGSHAFAFCIGISSCTIGTSVSSISSYAFNHCSGLTSVNIPSGVTSIDSYAFYNCASLSSITVEAITPPALGTGAFDDTNCPIYVPCDSLAAYQSAWSRYASRLQCMPTPSYSGQYLTLVAEENGTFTFSPGLYESVVIYYSTDSGTTWIQDTAVTVSNGDKVMWKGTMTSFGDSVGSFSASTGHFKAYGNIMSLVYRDFSGKTSLEGYEKVFENLFKNCSGLTSIDNLVMPATTLANSCYKLMFYKCSSLTAVPTNLLPSTVLADSCYFGMFEGCSSLTTAPELPATTLTARCYQLMFNMCTNINYIKCLATDISASRSTANWVRAVAASGTFVTPSSTNWSNGMSGIPNGWTRVNA